MIKHKTHAVEQVTWDFNICTPGINCMREKDGEEEEGLSSMTFYAVCVEQRNEEE